MIQLLIRDKLNSWAFLRESKLMGYFQRIYKGSSFLRINGLAQA